jgi:hypothetical protein
LRPTAQAVAAAAAAAAAARGGAVALALLAAVAASAAGCAAPHSLARLMLRTDPECAPCEGTVAEHVRTGSSPGDERGPFETWRLTMGGGEVIEYRVPRGLGMPLDGAPLGERLVVRHEHEERPTSTVAVIVRDKLWVADRDSGALLFAAGGGTAGRVDLPGVRVEMDTTPGSPARAFKDVCGVHTMHRIRFTPDPGDPRAPHAKRLWPGERRRLRFGGHVYRATAVAATRGPAEPLCPGYDGTEFAFVIVRAR